MKFKEEKIVVILGTTASKKSDLGIYLAQKFNGEIVSCDSRQVFMHLNLSSGKVTPEEQAIIPHHLLDIADLKGGKPFSVAEFQSRAYNAINDILKRGKLPILVGGTGLYVRAITEGYSLSKAKPNNKLRKSLTKLSRAELIEKACILGAEKDDISGLSPAHLIRRIEALQNGEKGKPQNKPRYNCLKLGMTFPKEVLHERIKKRIDVRLQQGMIEEIQELLNKGISPEFLISLGLECKHITQYLLGQVSYDEFYEELFKKTRHFAKRQLTWFKRDEDVHWLNLESNFEKEAEGVVKKFLKSSL